MRSNQDSLHIAIIGAGASGLTAAWLIQRLHQVTLFEKNSYLGGHTNTLTIPNGPDKGTPVDTGFIVLNDKNYPLLHRLLDRLKVPVRWSDMSFGFCSEKSGLYYAGTGLDGLFAQRRNVVNPAFYQLLMAIAGFCRTARKDLAEGTVEGRTLGDYLALRRVPATAVRNYIIPMGAAIWSATQADMLGFPAETLLRFWNNHGLLALSDRPRWQTVAGGSQSYVKAIRKDFSGEVVLNARIRTVRRTPKQAIVIMQDGTEHAFDQVILATHADEALQLLEEPTPEERNLLGPWKYQHNNTVLHTDTSLMPAARRAWASWNYVELRDHPAGRPVPVTYWMNHLQGLQTSEHYLVTLNPAREIPPERVVRRIDYTHPVFSFEAISTQPALPKLNGRNRSNFCGSYFGYGFHEDAVRSGVAVAKMLGVDFA